MKPVVKLIIGIVICLALPVAAYFWVTGMVDSLFNYRSPLMDTPPAAGEKIGQPATRRLVFVLVDALRYDTSQKADVMPTLASLRERGAWALMHSQPPSYSEAGYSTLLTGGWPYLNDGPAFNLEYADIPTWTQDNLFSAASRAGLKTGISGYYWFEKLVPQDAVSAHFYTPGEDAAADQAVLDAALPWLDDPKAYQLVLIHIDQVDYAGHHEGGPRSKNWTAAARRADDMIAQILAKLDLSKDTLLVASDHGQINQGGHGGQDAITLQEPFILAGAGVKPGKYPDIQMVDFAPTVAALLGLNVPASAQGQAQTAMLALPEKSGTALTAAQSAQQEKLVKAYSAAIDQEVIPPVAASVKGWQKALEDGRTAKASRERMLRVIPAMLVVLGALLVLYRWRDQRAGWVLFGALIYLALFNLRYVFLDGLTYSFSSVKGATDLVMYCVISVAVILLISWIIFAWGGKLFHNGAGEAARSSLGFGLAVAWVLALPAALHFVVNGFTAAWTLPEPTIFFLGMLSLVQMMIVCLVSLVLCAVSALIGWLISMRQRKQENQFLSRAIH